MIVVVLDVEQRRSVYCKGFWGDGESRLEVCGSSQAVEGYGVDQKRALLCDERVSCEFGGSSLTYRRRCPRTPRSYCTEEVGGFMTGFRRERAHGSYTE